MSNSKNFYEKHKPIDTHSPYLVNIKTGNIVPNIPALAVECAHILVPYSSTTPFSSESKSGFDFMSLDT